MLVASDRPTTVAFRNFNLCPHCIQEGEQGLLWRLCEGIPMISRSDGETFHLLLADRPLPYPAERNSGRIQKLSLCFWYSHGRNRNGASLVIVPGRSTRDPGIFRRIESIADALSEKLSWNPTLAPMYELSENGLREATI